MDDKSGELVEKVKVTGRGRGVRDREVGTRLSEGRRELNPEDYL